MFKFYVYIDFLQEAINMAESNRWNRFGKSSLKSSAYDAAVRIKRKVKLGIIKLLWEEVIE